MALNSITASILISTVIAFFLIVCFAFYAIPDICRAT